MMPTRTYRNPTPPIVFPCGMLGIGAALNYVVPACIFRRCWLRTSVRFAASTQAFLLETTAGLGFSSIKAFGNDEDDSSAIASATPSRLLHVGQRYKSSKTLLSQIQRWSSHREKSIGDYIKNRKPEREKEKR